MKKKDFPAVIFMAAVFMSILKEMEELESTLDLAAPTDN